MALQIAFFHWNRYGKKYYIYTIQNAILAFWHWNDAEYPLPVVSQPSGFCLSRNRGTTSR